MYPKLMETIPTFSKVNISSLHKEALKPSNHCGIKNVFCYSGGTEAIAMFSTIAKTLSRQGSDIVKLSYSSNLLFAVKYEQNEQPVICFSRVYSHASNPSGHYAAVVNGSFADKACPIVFHKELWYVFECVIANENFNPNILSFRVNSLEILKDN